MRISHVTSMCIYEMTCYVYDEFSDTQLSNDKYMKAYAYMLPRVICEEYVRLCHMNDFRMKSIGTSCILYLHLHWDTSPFMMMSTDTYTMIMMMIMPCMIFKGLLYLQTFGYSQLARL